VSASDVSLVAVVGRGCILLRRRIPPLHRWTAAAATTTGPVPVPGGDACTPFCAAFPAATAAATIATCPAIRAAAPPVIAATATTPVTAPAVPAPAVATTPETTPAFPEAIVTTASVPAAAALPALVAAKQMPPQVPAGFEGVGGSQLSSMGARNLSRQFRDTSERMCNKHAYR